MSPQTRSSRRREYWLREGDINARLHFRKSSGAKRVLATIICGEVWLSIPSKWSESKGYAGLVGEFRAEVVKALERQREYIDRDDAICLWGNLVPYRIVAAPRKSYSFVDGVLVISGPSGDAEKMIDEVRRKEVVAAAAPLVEKWANIMGMRVPSIKTQGSFRAVAQYNRRDHVVKFSTILTRMDRDMIEFFVLHELCHYFHFNHSAAFYNTFAKYMPDHREWRKRFISYCK